MEFDERLKGRLLELRQTEGMAWAELHAIQGRIAELEMWLGAIDKEEPAITMGEFVNMIERGAEKDQAEEETA